MANLCDHIEAYLKEQLARAAGVVEVQRAELALRFECVPSQINYVLDTRFTPERGYLVESRRGGGGYIRIVRLPMDTAAELVRALEEQIGGMVGQDGAVGFIDRLEEAGHITGREADLMRAAVDRRVLAIDLPWRDVVRAAILKAMVRTLLRHAAAGGVPTGGGPGAAAPAHRVAHRAQTRRGTS